MCVKSVKSICLKHTLVGKISSRTILGGIAVVVLVVVVVDVEVVGKSWTTVVVGACGG